MSRIQSSSSKRAVSGCTGYTNVGSSNNSSSLYFYGASNNNATMNTAGNNYTFNGRTKWMRRCDSAAALPSLMSTCESSQHQQLQQTGTLKKQGADYLVEIDEKILSIYGQGALKHALMVNTYGYHRRSSLFSQSSFSSSHVWFMLRARCDKA